MPVAFAALMGSIGAVPPREIAVTNALLMGRLNGKDVTVDDLSKQSKVSQREILIGFFIVDLLLLFKDIGNMIFGAAIHYGPVMIVIFYHIEHSTF